MWSAVGFEFYTLLLKVPLVMLWEQFYHDADGDWFGGFELLPLRFDADTDTDAKGSDNDD